MRVPALCINAYYTRNGHVFGFTWVRLKLMHTNSAMLEITPGVQGLPCLHNPIARQALHSRVAFYRTRFTSANGSVKDKTSPWPLNWELS